MQNDKAEGDMDLKCKVDLIHEINTRVDMFEEK